LTANYGIYGPAYELMESRALREGGEEYADSEKYQLRDWDRKREDSLLPLLKTLNSARHQHPSLQQNDTLHFHDTDNPMILCYSKRAGTDMVLVVVNLDTANIQSGWTMLDLAYLGLANDVDFECKDLLADNSYSWSGSRNFVMLDPNVLPAHLFHVSLPVSNEQR
jgi:starch synthase (maltosyl-transferring)